MKPPKPKLAPALRPVRPATAGSPAGSRPPITRGEAVVVFVVFLAAAVLRFAFPGRIVIEHWDEAVYASNLLSGGSGYPARHLYGPPFLPAVIEWTMVALGTTSFAAVLPNLLVGTLMIPLCWWAAREWFGPAAGIAAATLAALSDFHALYCRTALTDVFLCFWFLLAVYLAWRALTRNHLREALRTGAAAGLATAAAWSSKYNGWLPLAVALSGFMAWVIFARIEKPVWTARLPVLSVVVVTAVICWAPVWLSLQPTGGYAAVAQNHARFVVGLSGWPAAFGRQLANHWHYNGWPSDLSIGIAILLASLIARWKHGADRARTALETSSTRAPSDAKSAMTGANAVALFLAAAAAAIAFASGATAVMMALALGIGPCFWEWRRSEQASRKFPARSLAGWLVAAWMVGLFVSTPAYTPFSRLTLPWLVSTWMASAAVIGTAFDAAFADRAATAGAQSAIGRFSLRTVLIAVWLAVSAAIVASTAVLGWGVATAGAVPEWSDKSARRTAILQAADIAAESAGSTGDSGRSKAAMLFFVYGEPAIYFHLASHGYQAAPVAGLDFLAPGSSPLPQPAFLITYRTPEFEGLAEPYLARLELLAAVRDTPSDLVLLESHHPSELTGPAGRPDEELRVYRIKSP